MDWLQFFADIVKSIVSLAWPAAFVVAVWMFRGKLTELLPFLRFKYKDLDIAFRLKEAEMEVKELKPPDKPVEPTPEETDKFNRLANISPRAAITELRVELEQAVQDFARSVNLISAAPYPGMYQLTHLLRKHDLIDRTTSGLLDDLRSIGNLAAHNAGADITKEDAERFRVIAVRLIQQLQITTAAAQMPPPAPLRDIGP